MALAVRELELILIARDHASAVIARVGGAMVILGAAIATTGVKGVRELGSMAMEAAEFRQQIALAVTQADGLGANIQNVSKIVNTVGKDLPVPFEELNDAMFDIFSTFTSDQLSSLDQAEGILKQFGESAVAGQAPIRDIARSTIAWINALDQPATIENVSKLLDIQFELVRKGAGEYGEFAGEVGKAIPAFTAANQSVETFSGAMAFMTKNGLSAAMAATSAARAVELMFSTKAIEGLKDIGVEIEDNEGNFRAMEDILRDLVPIFDKLSDSQKKIKFKEIFGLGRIQARRFFDLAIPNFAELEELIGDMEQSAGGVASAFDLMMDQPLSKMETFKNKWELLRRTIGDTFLKSLTTVVFPILDDLFDWWDGLTEEQQEQIAVWLAWGAAILVAAGALMIVLGIGLLIIALLRAFGEGKALAGIARIALTLGPALLIFLLIAGAAWLIWKNWSKIKPLLIGIWGEIKKQAQKFKDANIKFFNTIRDKFTEIWEKMKELGSVVWLRIQQAWEIIWAALILTWERWGGRIIQAGEAIWEQVKIIFLAALDVIIGIIDLFIAIFQGSWEGIKTAIVDIAKALWTILVARFLIGFLAVVLLWDLLWDTIKLVAASAVKVFGPLIASMWKKIKEWAGIILDFFLGLPITLVTMAAKLGVLLGIWIGKAFLWLVLKAGEVLADHVIPWFIKLPGVIISALAKAGNWLVSVGKNILTGLWEGIKFYWRNFVKPYFFGFGPKVLKTIGNLLVTLFSVGWKILLGLLNGIKSFWDGTLRPWFQGVGGRLKGAIGFLKN